jgi:hypothetical protein
MKKSIILLCALTGSLATLSISAQNHDQWIPPFSGKEILNNLSNKKVIIPTALIIAIAGLSNRHLIRRTWAQIKEAWHERSLEGIIKKEIFDCVTASPYPLSPEEMEAKISLAQRLVLKRRMRLFSNMTTFSAGCANPPGGLAYLATRYWLKSMYPVSRSKSSYRNTIAIAIHNRNAKAIIRAVDNHRFGHTKPAIQRCLQLGLVSTTLALIYAWPVLPHAWKKTGIQIGEIMKKTYVKNLPTNWKHLLTTTKDCTVEKAKEFWSDFTSKT